MPGQRRLDGFRNLFAQAVICSALFLLATPASGGVLSWLTDPSPEFVKAIQSVKINPPKGIRRNSRAARTYVYWNTAVAYNSVLFRVGGMQKEWRYLGQAMIKIPVKGVDAFAVKEVLQIAHNRIELADEWDRISAPSAASYFTVGKAIMEMILTAPKDKRRAVALEAETTIVAKRLSAKYKLRFRRFVFVRK